MEEDIASGCGGILDLAQVRYVRLIQAVLYKLVFKCLSV